jgi:hypothetical protein
MARRGWKEKRAAQGFSYDEVLEEMKRRKQGERIFSCEEAEIRFERGVQRLNRIYRLSASFNDILEREGLTYHDVLKLTGTIDHDCTLSLLLDPVSNEEGQSSLRHDEFVDGLYPGPDPSLEEE